MLAACSRSQQAFKTYSRLQTVTFHTRAALHQQLAMADQPKDKTLTKGDALPALKAGTLRIYSMRFCPFANRARLSLAHHSVPVEMINIDTANKPEWYPAEKNPAGSVPCLEIDDKKVVESRVCMEYIDDAYGKSGLVPKDPYVKAKAAIVMENAAKLYPTYLAALKGWEKVKAQETLDNSLPYFEQHLEYDFFGGSEVSLADLYIWPWFERLPMMKLTHDIDSLPKDKYPKLVAWVERMKGTQAVKKTMFSPETYVKFAKSVQDGTNDFDFIVKDMK